VVAVTPGANFSNGMPRFRRNSPRELPRVPTFRLRRLEVDDHELASDLLSHQGEMPSGDAITAGLAETANTWRSLAIAWHLILAAPLVAFLAGCRLSTRLIAVIAIALVLCVSALSWVSGNPFNGIVFGALAITLARATVRSPGAAAQIESLGRALPGAALVVFGWTYPHFVSTDSWTEYAYAAPLGLIPCPTLSVVVGLTMLVHAAWTSAWTLPLIIVAFAYGIVGLFALHVALDVVLVAGALVLAAVTMRESGRFPSASHLWRVSHREGEAP